MQTKIFTTSILKQLNPVRALSLELRRDISIIFNRLMINLGWASQLVSLFIKNEYIALQLLRSFYKEGLLYTKNVFFILSAGFTGCAVPKVMQGRPYLQTFRMFNLQSALIWLTVKLFLYEPLFVLHTNRAMGKIYCIVSNIQ